MVGQRRPPAWRGQCRGVLGGQRHPGLDRSLTIKDVPGVLPGDGGRASWGQWRCPWSSKNHGRCLGQGSALAAGGPALHHAGTQDLTGVHAPSRHPRLAPGCPFSPGGGPVPANAPVGGRSGPGGFSRSGGMGLDRWVARSWRGSRGPPLMQSWAGVGHPAQVVGGRVGTVPHRLPQETPRGPCAGVRGAPPALNTEQFPSNENQERSAILLVSSCGEGFRVFFME